ncbi:MAG: NUDIX domain-containing protein, partial [Candidatus Omnitrophota bacterium]
IDDAVIIEKIGETRYFYKLKGRPINKTVFLYLCETNQERLKAQESEIEDARWFSPKDALNKIEYRGSGALLKKALRRYASLNGLTIKRRG